MTEHKPIQQINNTLYALNKDGSIQQWSVYVDEVPHYNLVNVIVEFGKKGGKIQRKITQITEGKNIGKANETTPLQQAISEAQSKWNKQVRLGYKENESELNSNPVLTPMLAQDGAKKPHLIKYPCYVQPKLDGVRCLVEFKDNGEITFTSRGNKQYPQHEHLVESLKWIKEQEPQLKYLDGEIYLHGYALQDIVSLVKKPQEGSEFLEFWIFDIPTENKTFKERVIELDDMYHSLKSKDLDSWNDFSERPIKFTESVNAPDEEWMLHRLDTYIEDGFEGVIVRNEGGLYEFSQRSNDLIKVKKMQDTEVKVVAVEEDKNGEGVLVCQDKDLFSVKLKMLGSHEYRKYENMLTLKGKYITMKFQARTKDQSYQFPVGIAVRELDENWNPLE